MQRSLHDQASSSLGSVDLASALHMSSAQSHIDAFRFLDLPPEIRNEIYKNLLCTFEARDPQAETEYSFLEEAAIPEEEISPGGGRESETSIDAIKVKHSIETQILRVSKQVYHEAYDVMLKENLFVRITCNSTQVGTVVLKDVPVITMNRRHILAFDGYAMHHCMYADDASDTVTEFMLLHRDLDLFCDWLVHANVSIPYFTDTYEHILTLFDRPTSMYALTTQFQERLLKCYTRGDLNGFHRFQICGSVDHTLWRSALATITWTFTKPEEAIGFFSSAWYQMKNEAADRVVGICHRYIGRIISLRHSKTWDALLANGSPEFRRRIVSIAHSFCCFAFLFPVDLDEALLKEASRKAECEIFTFHLYRYLRRSSVKRIQLAITMLHKLGDAFHRDGFKEYPRTFRLIHDFLCRYRSSWKDYRAQVNELLKRYNEKTSAEGKTSDLISAQKEWPLKYEAFIGGVNYPAIG
ncbi:uncharacterized protein BDZ99DRAFT_575279 [Mytilinidion resinicola]|uniref:Uncharacterized protein n=1 Tax=Mytilinidion resinicola TaxID=574789 RepID=A0A6A6Y743_9PEZI|nr:uncharacterized protein BDZ99DRAFT_575279 [Mytilinidion resinicola]KAF2804632.1 hypothetical protein BDZ99DRAFT_575279 [Mytilinidion resinicola]